MSPVIFWQEREKMSIDVFSESINGRIGIGDIVISTPSDEYTCLVGEVLDIVKLGTPEHDAETDNPTDNVHVNFMDADYSAQRVREIEDMFSDLYGEKKSFGDCPIDDTIMAPDSLIRITGIDPKTRTRILDSEEAAAEFCDMLQATL